VHIEATTPPERDRMIDALRAGSILCVILGHWLVTAPVVERSGVRITSPLAAMPSLVPLTWALQVLALFFFVGGYANSRSLDSARAAGHGYRRWLAGRARRLGRPVMILLIVWAAAGGLAVAAGVPVTILQTVGLLVMQPLWFILVYLFITALTPITLAAYQRLGLWTALASGLVVGVVDLLQFGHGTAGAGKLRWVTVVFAWLVAYLLGIAWANDPRERPRIAQYVLENRHESRAPSDSAREHPFRSLHPTEGDPTADRSQTCAQGRTLESFHGHFYGLRSRRAGLLLVVGGGMLAGVLIVWGGYPASMVGVTGAARSNLNPPSLLVPAVGCLQIGVVLLVRDRLARLLQRSQVWAIAALMNRSAMTLFLWHQTALAMVALALAPWGQLSGLHTMPSEPAWIWARLGWLPLFAAVLAILWASFRRFERA
jgi:hypothetical protein